MAPAVCIELKSKWGALPAALTVHPDHSIKLHASKFQLQQALKLAQARTFSTVASMPILAACGAIDYICSPSV